MTRILIIGRDQHDLADYAQDELGYNINPAHLPSTITDYRGVFHFATPTDKHKVRGYQWDEIRPTDRAGEHPDYPEFIDQVLPALKSIPIDIHKVTPPPDARTAAAIEVAEAYRDWSSADEPGAVRANRLTAAADAWENVR